MSGPASTVRSQTTPIINRFKKYLFDTVGKPFLRSYFRLLNIMCRIAAGGRRREIFYDIQEVYPSLKILDDNVEIIKEEFQGILQQKSSLPRYHELDDIQKEISDATENDWKVFMLDVCGENADSSNQCPRTRALLEKIPHVNQAFFSILEAHKSVPAHDGPYCGYLRYHLGVQVPTDNPPHIRILDKKYTWQQDRSVLFDDSWNHEVVNHSNQIRAILLVDVLRPLPSWLHKLNLAWTNYVGKFYSRRLLGRLENHDYTL